MFINSSRGGHGTSFHEAPADSQRSSSSSLTQNNEPPKVYEEMI
jgi:hypothetical protein